MSSLRQQHIFYSFLLLLTFLTFSSVAQVATLPFTDCFNGNNAQKLNITTVYGQVLPSGLGQSKEYLNLILFGESPQEIAGFSNSSTSLATLFTTTSVLTLNAFTNSSYFCSSLRPPSPLPAVDNTTLNYCPIPAGSFAFSSTVPWGDDRALTTLTTRLRAVDPFSKDLFCLEISTTPLSPVDSSPYGKAQIILWFTVTLTAAYWAVVGVARISSAWGRGITRPSKGLWERAQSAGFILASAISGERLTTSPALLRFSTPSMRDLIFHTQWCAALAMVAVEWPDFVYPLLAQTSWSTLTYNVTLTSTSNSQSHHWDPLSTQPFLPPSGFADQISDPSSPLFIDTTVPNTLFMLPPHALDGIDSFAYTVGLRPQDLFPVCLILFLAIIAGTIALSIAIWLLDCAGSFLSTVLVRQHGQPTRLTGTRSPAFKNKDMLDSSVQPANPEESKSLTGNGHHMFRPPSRFTLSGGGGSATGKSLWKSIGHFRPDISSFHGNVLQGNLVRILVLFHLPITIFSCYQMTLSRTRPELFLSRTSIALAGISFALLSLIFPALLVFRVTITTTNKLYDETRTLLSLGPLYNHYRHGSQMFASLLFATNVAFGAVIGCGQKSGTAQAIIILVIEVISALVTSVWLPWGTGASMGLISFLFCVARIVIAVLLVILTPTINIGGGAGGWVAYGILIILALVYLALLLMLVVKLIEALVRIFGRVPFDRSTHIVDSGLLGACGMLGCCGPRRRRRHPRRRQYKSTEVSRRESAPSEFSSYLPPNVPGGEGNGSRKGSMHSGVPPSVLRPEHALRPYREDSDDESGFIMGAWQPFPRPGYGPVRDQSSSPVKQPTPGSSTGFSRIGGGRAHIDTPYAIASGSTQTFPSIGHQSAATGLVFSDDDSPPPSLSNVARYPEGGLPPGAMQPSHIRTKSQTAIIEDASALVLSVPQSLSRPDSNRNRPTALVMSSPDDDESDAAPKKKPWYHLRRHRPSTEGNQASSSPAPADIETGGLSSLDPPSQSQPTRSFVVIRKPQSSPATSNQPSGGPGNPSTNPTTSTQGSFSRNTRATS